MGFVQEYLYTLLPNSRQEHYLTKSLLVTRMCRDHTRITSESHEFMDLKRMCDHLMHSLQAQ